MKGFWEAFWKGWRIVVRFGFIVFVILAMFEQAMYCLGYRSDDRVVLRLMIECIFFRSVYGMDLGVDDGR